MKQLPEPGGDHRRRRPQRRRPTAPRGHPAEAIDRYALPGAAASVEVKAAVLGERAEVPRRARARHRRYRAPTDGGTRAARERRQPLALRRRVAKDAVGELGGVAEDPCDGEPLVRDDAARKQRGAPDGGVDADVAVRADGRRTPGSGRRPRP